MLFLCVTPLVYSSPPTPPWGISAKFLSLDSSRIKIMLDCYSIDRFSKGIVYLLISADSGATPDSIVLWNGSWNGDTSKETFQKSFSHSFTSLKSKKSLIVAIFRFKAPRSTELWSVDSRSFLLHLADTILVDQSYDDLEDAEIIYDLKKGGYEGLSDEQLRKVNHELWKRIIRRHGGGERE